MMAARNYCSLLVSVSLLRATKDENSSRQLTRRLRESRHEASCIQSVVGTNFIYLFFGPVSLIVYKLSRRFLNSGRPEQSNTIVKKDSHHPHPQCHEIATVYDTEYLNKISFFGKLLCLKLCRGEDKWGRSESVAKLVLSGATCVSSRITFDLLHINGALHFAHKINARGSLKNIQLFFIFTEFSSLRMLKKKDRILCRSHFKTRWLPDKDGRTQGRVK